MNTGKASGIDTKKKCKKNDLSSFRDGTMMKYEDSA